MQGQVGPRPCDDRFKYQFVVSGGTDHDGADVWTRAADSVEGPEPGFVGVEIDNQVFESLRRKQFLETPSYWNQLHVLFIGRLVKNAGQPCKANRLIRHQSNADRIWFVDAGSATLRQLAPPKKLQESWAQCFHARG